MKSLAEKRPVFHSEADFQFAFAWEIKLQYSRSNPRLEYVIPGLKNHVDVWVRLNGKKQCIPIELKYKTRKSIFTIEEEKFSLKNQGAQDQGRYDIVNDIRRIEKVVDGEKCPVGITVSLTNDPSYWKQTTKRLTVDHAFHLSEGKMLGGELKWAGSPKEGTIKNRDKPIELTHEYTLTWMDYSLLTDETSGKFGRFRYLTTVCQGQA